MMPLMRWYKKISNFLRFPVAIKLLFIEGLFTTAWVKFNLLFLPFARVAGWLGKANATQPSSTSEANKKHIAQVKAVIVLCEKYAPWPAECYTRSVTAKLMLKRRGLFSTLYLGFRKNSNNQLEGHAWLVCNDVVVTGACDFSLYKVHSTFS